MSFSGATGTPCFGFLVTSPLGFKARVGSALFAIFAEANVMYIPQDSPLVLHLPTSWRPARSQSLPHMHICRRKGARGALHFFLIIIIKLPMERSDRTERSAGALRRSAPGHRSAPTERSAPPERSVGALRGVGVLRRSAPEHFGGK